VKRLVLAAGLLLAGCASTVREVPGAVAPIDEAEMRALIAPLASDAFEGRMSGTRAEQITVDFLSARLKQVGVAGGMADGGYEQRFAIADQKKPIPKDGPGMPSGQIEFMKAVNAQGATSSRNVVGVVRGRNSDGRAVVMMAHWDHLGICRPADPVDKVCNGASDNASGTAAVLAVAARVAQMGLDRDVWFVFTGAEEWGLLGAEAFAANPTLPLASIVAGFNMDTIAVGPKGEPVAMLAADNSPLEKLVRETAESMGRKWDGDDEIKPFLKRQDGYAFVAKGVPMVMAGGSFSDMKKLMAYLGGHYHGIDDELDDAIELGGATEDANLHVELVRRAASRGFRP
jgi:hypothetical protein